MTIGTGTVRRAAPAPNEQWAFPATPPRRNPLPGREDTRTLPVLIRGIGRVAEVWVDGRMRACASRATLLAWLDQSGSREPYVAAPLILRYSDLGVWFEVPTFTAPTILTESAVQQIVRVLRT